MLSEVLSVSQELYLKAVQPISVPTTLKVSLQILLRVTLSVGGAWYSQPTPSGRSISLHRPWASGALMGGKFAAVFWMEATPTATIEATAVKPTLPAKRTPPAPAFPPSVLLSNIINSKKLRPKITVSYGLVSRCGLLGRD